jgi:hypothetical protein
LRLFSATSNRGLGTTWCPAKEPTSHFIIEIVTLFGNTQPRFKAQGEMNLSFSDVSGKKLWRKYEITRVA